MQCTSQGAKACSSQDPWQLLLSQYRGMILGQHRQQAWNSPDSFQHLYSMPARRRLHGFAQMLCWHKHWHKRRTANAFKAAQTVVGAPL